jgi:hypothetical protein
MLTLKEFLNTVYHTEKYIVIPPLNRRKVNKIQFIDKEGKYDTYEQNEYLKKLYKKIYEKNTI